MLDVTARLSDSEGVVPAGQVSPDLATSLALSFHHVMCGGPTNWLWELNHLVVCEATMIHNVLMCDLMMTHNGYEVHMSGLKASMGASTFCVTFHQVIDAVAWCSTAQCALVAADWPAGLLCINGAHTEYGNSSNEHFVYCGLRVCMGVHVGPVRCIMDPKTRHAEYIGPVVKGAMAIAHMLSGSQVLMSPNIKAKLTNLPDEIGRMRPLQIQHMGNINLKQAVPKGITYQLLHCNLKSSNLLMDNCLTVKVADFGFVCIKENNATMTNFSTPMWSTPEVIQGLDYSMQADVYSFSVILWEILTHKVPYTTHHIRLSQSTALTHQAMLAHQASQKAFHGEHVQATGGHHQCMWQCHTQCVKLVVANSNNVFAFLAHFLAV
jgi:hypothetical protein